MAVTSQATLGRLMDRLGFTLLRVAGGHLDPDVIVRSLTVYDFLDPQPLSEDTLILGVGLADAKQAEKLIRTVGSAKVAGAVLRESLVTDQNVARAVHETGTPVFGLVNGASWIQVTSILISALGLDDETLAGIEVFGDPESDLFALASSIAALAGGPVTIEDASSRILAFSADQDQADNARKESVLGRQVPKELSAKLQQRGEFQRIYASPLPVYVDSLQDGVSARVAMRLQAGNEVLGSIWVMLEEPLSVQRQQALAEAANIVALAILRSRITKDSTSRLRSALVSSLIAGGTEARDTASKTGLNAKATCILALGIYGEPAADSTTEFHLQRLTSALNLYLRAIYPNAQAALIGDTIYSVLPLVSKADQRARSCAVEFVERVRRSTDVLVGIGRVVEDVSQLGKSRTEADRALRVLRQKAHHLEAPRVATAADVQVESLLLQMTDVLNDSQETVAGPLAMLDEYDASHNSDLVATLRAWLHFFGDVARAADSLHVHKNTFRYRLRRLSEVGGVDLSDPDERFRLMMQLRLFPDRL